MPSLFANAYGLQITSNDIVNVTLVLKYFCKVGSIVVC